MPVRPRASLFVLLLGLCAGVLAVLAAARLTADVPGVGPGVRPAAPTAVVKAVQPFALGVLRDWDDRRAAAWAAGDPALLARLYTAGSSAGTSDVALLRRYRARGLVVRDLRMQVLRARVLISRPGLVVLEVTDRLASAVAHGPTSGARRLPRDVATSHVLVLRRVGGAWRMARVSGPAER